MWFEGMKPLDGNSRSKLAECLGVEDGQKFIFKNDVYSVECSGEKLRQWSSDGMNFWREMEIDVLLDMIAHPEEITPYPRWSEATIAAAGAAYLIGFRYVMRRGNEPQALLTVAHTCNNGFYADLDLFPEIHPGTTVKLEDIVNG